MENKASGYADAVENSKEKLVEDNRTNLKYLTLDAELFLNDKLNKIDCLVFAMIYLYDGENHCFASNKYIATLFGVTETTISTSISRLREEGYIEIVSFDGRKRVIAVKADYKDTHSLLLKNLNGRIKSSLKYIKKEYKEPFISTSSNDDVEHSDECVTSPNNRVSIVRREIKSKKFIASELHPPSIEEKKPINPKVPTEEERNIIDRWISSGLHMPKIGTKSYNKSITMLKSLIKKHGTEKVKDAIDNFSLAAFDERYEPANLTIKLKYRKVILSDFIYNRFMKPQSLFEKYTEPPVLINKLIEDKNPAITARLKALYKEEVLGNARVTMSPKEENCFRRAAIMIKELYKNNEKRFNRFMRIGDTELANFYFESLKASSRDVSNIMPHWFCANVNINNTFPAYLFRQGILESGRDSFQEHHPATPPNQRKEKFSDLQISY